MGVSTTNSLTKIRLLPDTKHSFRVRAVRGNSVSEWSGVVKGKTLRKWDCAWKECLDNVNDNRKYDIDKKNPRIATKINDGDYYCTVIGNTHIPLNKVTPWSIKVLKSRDNDGSDIYIGVAPFDINQNEVNYDKRGWYFYCYSSKLWSGPPHNYMGKDYGPRKENGEYIHTGDSVGVVMDTTKGELSFVLNGVNLGVAYEGIPLDKPLVPCVLLENEGDSVWLDPSGVKGANVDSSIPVPSNIAVKNATWNSITLTWGEISGASFYQVEMDGSRPWSISTTNSLIKRGLLLGTEHSFRVRAVRGNSVSEWSGVVKGKTLKKWDCVWEECPDDVGEKMHMVDEKHPRIATKVNDNDWRTFIGSTPIPLNTVISWSIKVLKSKDNDGGLIFIGIAPSDINQKFPLNFNKCGWYFGCYWSTLWSGPPHNYRDKEYGQKKGESGQYIHTGDSVGVVVDTIKGDISFVLNGVNCGAAYEGIPFDKPLVPCVILYYKGDSIELAI